MNIIQVDTVHVKDKNGKFRIFDTRHFWCKEATVQVLLNSTGTSTVRLIYSDHVRTYAGCVIIYYCASAETSKEE